jgi:hypothetical protein
VIVRILGEGQWELGEDQVAELNAHDALVEAAVESGDEESFRSSLTGLLDAVRSRGTAVAADALVESDLILPMSDATIEEVRDLLSEEGLIPD